MYTRRNVILAKIETVYGTDPTPTPAANAILTSKPEFKLLTERVERAFISPTISSLAPRLALPVAQITFDVEMRAGASAGVAPDVSPLLRACGLDETIVGGTSVTYLPVSESFESCTIWWYIDGRCHKMNGCRGNMKLKAEVGRYGIYTFELQGLYSSPVTLSLPSPSYSGQLPEIVQQATARLEAEGTATAGTGTVSTTGSSTTVTTTGGAFSVLYEGAKITANSLTRYVVSKTDNNTVIVDTAVDWSGGYSWTYKNVGVTLIGLELDLGNELFRRDDVIAANGVAEIVLADRNTKGGIEPELRIPLEAQNFWTGLINRTAYALTFGWGYNAGAQRINISAPKIKFDDIGYGEKGPMVTQNLPFVCEYDSGDDELQIQYL